MRFQIYPEHTTGSVLPAVQRSILGSALRQTTHYRWRLVADNGQIIAASNENFDSKSNARRAAENVRDKAGAADIEDV